MDLEPVKHLNIRCTVVAYRLAYDILVIVPLRGEVRFRYIHFQSCPYLLQGKASARRVSFNEWLICIQQGFAAMRVFQLRCRDELRNDEEQLSTSLKPGV